MIWFLIAIVSALAAGAWNAHEDGAATGVMAFVFIAFFGSIFAFIINIPFMYTGGEEWEARETRTLQNVREDSETSGGFFLIAGGFDEDATFKFYSEREGVYKLQTVDAEDARIVMDGSEPRVVKEVLRYDPNKWLSVLNTDSNYPRYTFYIPKGSIKQNYALGE